jgi:hypothetical protein
MLQLPFWRWHGRIANCASRLRSGLVQALQLPAGNMQAHSTVVASLALVLVPSFCYARRTPAAPTVYVNAQTANIYLNGAPQPNINVNPAPPAPTTPQLVPSDETIPAVSDAGATPAEAAEADRIVAEDVEDVEARAAKAATAEADRTVGWSLIGSGAVFLIPAYVWHHQGDVDLEARPTATVLSDAWLCASLTLGVVGGYEVYRGYAEDPPTVEVSAAPAPDGGAFELSGTF